MKTVFLDTNIVIDFYSKRGEFYQPALMIFDLAKEEKFKIAVSATTFINAFYILRKIYEKTELKQKMISLSKICIITDVTSDNVYQALNSEFKDFEDCIQVFSCKNIASDIIVTRNKKDFLSSKIRVLDPIEFLTEIS